MLIKGLNKPGYDVGRSRESRTDARHEYRCDAMRYAEHNSGGCAGNSVLGVHYIFNWYFAMQFSRTRRLTAFPSSGGPVSSRQVTGSMPKTLKLDAMEGLEWKKSP